MNSLFTKTLKIRAEHVDFRRKMRLSVLMRLFQECCIAHTEELGMGRKMTLDRGFLWVITNEHIKVTRLPEYDEDVVLESYPGPTLHYFFPRHFVMKDREGNVLIEISAIWALIDIKTRSMIDPKENGIVINGWENGKEIPMVTFLKVPPLNKKETIVATYSMVDINGHLNNTAYVDLALDRFEKEDLKRDIAEVKMTFKKEIPLGASFELAYDKIDHAYYLTCPHFSLEIDLN